MAITGVSNYTSYTNYYADTKQTASKTYGNAREYRKYLTEKYDCLKSKDYSVAINGSLMAQAASDEKIAKWLEYNLSIMPECIEKTREAAEARGAKLISCNITINEVPKSSMPRAGFG